MCVCIKKKDGWLSMQAGSNHVGILFIWLILFHKQEAGWLSSFGYYG
jgi:hypothetical protein